MRPEPNELERARQRIAELEKMNELILLPLRRRVAQLEEQEWRELQAQRDRIIAELQNVPPNVFKDSMGYD